MDSTYISFLFLVSVFIFIIEAPASFDWTADGDHRSPGIHNTVVLSTITRHLISSSPRQIYNYIRHMEIFPCPMTSIQAMFSPRRTY